MVNLKYAIALLMTINLLFIFVSIMNYFDMQRVITFSNDLSTFTIGAQDMEGSLALLQAQHGTVDCGIMDAAYQSEVTNTNDLMEKMLGYEDANLFGEFYALKDQFLLSNIQLFQVSELEKQYCPSNHADIMYVYSSNPDCPQCQVQGQILDSLRVDCNNTRIFVMDYDANLTSIEIMEREYNVTSAPTLIINGKAYPGIMNESSIKQLVSCGG